MPITGYDAKAILEFYDRRPLQVGWRLNSLGLPLLGWYIGLLADKAMGLADREAVQIKRGAELRQHLVHSGSVALIKSGQALSLRSDLVKVKGWTDELSKLVDAVGSFPDESALTIMKKELADLVPRIRAANEMPSVLRGGGLLLGGATAKTTTTTKSNNKLQSMVEKDPILSMFEFYNDYRAVASASIGQVYKARIKRGARLEAAIGKTQAAQWGGKLVAIKIQRPDAAASVSLDMYLLRRTAMWLSKFHGGDLPAIADVFGQQLFGELDYVREANNCERFGELYGDWDSVKVPLACTALTRKRVLVMEWVEGEKGPWLGDSSGTGSSSSSGIDMVRTGLKCSVDQLMNTGLFHADPHRGNLLRTTDGKLAFIDFGMMADVTEEECYGLVGLVIGLQNKDLPLVTEELLKLGFLRDTTQVDQLVPRLREAFRRATGGTGKASDVNFAKLQAELDAIARENVLKFSTPPFFTIIIRSLTILEGMALSADPNFRLVRGSYPYVLRQLLSENNEQPPEALQKLLSRLLTVNGEEREIEWQRLHQFLKLAQKAARNYNPTKDTDSRSLATTTRTTNGALATTSTSSTAADDKAQLSRQTIELFFKFLTSRTGIFLKKPLVHELAEAIDGMASMGEQNLLRWTALPPLPGMLGPVNTKRMDELRMMLDTFQDALLMTSGVADNSAAEALSSSSSLMRDAGPAARLESVMGFLREIINLLNDDRMREDAGPMMQEIQSVFQLVAVEVLEIRGRRAMRSVLRLGGAAGVPGRE